MHCNVWRVFFLFDEFENNNCVSIIFCHRALIIFMHYSNSVPLCLRNVQLSEMLRKNVSVVMLIVFLKYFFCYKFHIKWFSKLFIERKAIFSDILKLMKIYFESYQNLSYCYKIIYGYIWNTFLLKRFVIRLIKIIESSCKKMHRKILHSQLFILRYATRYATRIFLDILRWRTKFKIF